MNVFICTTETEIYLTIDLRQKKAGGDKEGRIKYIFYIFRQWKQHHKKWRDEGNNVDIEWRYIEWVPLRWCQGDQGNSLGWWIKFEKYKNIVQYKVWLKLGD